jgi:hypothetical protein
MGIPLPRSVEEQFAHNAFSTSEFNRKDPDRLIKQSSKKEAVASQHYFYDFI